MPEHSVTLVFDNFPALPEEELERLLAPLAENPPEGCTYELRYGDHMVTGIREADSRFAAVAEVAAEVKSRCGLAFNGAGIEKPDEWLGEDHGQQVSAHLVLAAVHRAKHCGVSPEELVRLIQAVRE
ncbi:hypothetical protein [Streptomyces boncukensis]|uniref:Uncharacterized protein n=1 Tax=Streptomyces boncukensis TaxID=2711219 RepID=A0A6G4X2J1_9ACTN|nr:hypothetical protein [Streptomyces boncukensis]NGO70881.1 hypothetical protein [Streptomyces boncukensis]